jgi:hypothetical protein
MSDEKQGGHLMARMESMIHRLDSAHKSVRHDLGYLVQAIERLEAIEQSRVREETPEELRFRLHLAEHRCHKDRGFGHCEDAMRLFREMPPELQVIRA